MFFFLPLLVNPYNNIYDKYLKMKIFEFFSYICSETSFFLLRLTNIVREINGLELNY